MPFVPPPAPTPTTAAAVLDYMQQVNREIIDLTEAARPYYGHNPGFTEAMAKAHDDFVRDWELFYRDYLENSWMGLILQSAAWDQTGQYEAKNEAWREVFRGIGIHSVAPGPGARPEPRDTIAQYKDLVITVGLVAAGIWLLTQTRLLK